MIERPETSLDTIRNEIDEIDAKLVELLNQRAHLAQEIGRIKGTDGRPFFTPERERQIYERLERINPGPLMTHQLAGIFREVISAARALEKPLAAAFWGPPGTFSHTAALTIFGSSSNYLPQPSIREVFLAVEHGQADYGVVPLENLLAGVVPETLDMFPRTNVKICAEAYIPIHHHLASIAKSLSEIERVYAGPQPAQQCRQWLQSNLPNAEIVEVVPTARAAQSALGDSHGAAIVSRFGAETIGIPLLVEHLEDDPKNNTRFVVVGYNEPNKTGRDKTSLMFNLRNKPGELMRALEALNQEEVNLLMIESRPAPRAAFEYLFFVDCEGHRHDDRIQRAIDSLRKHTLEAVVLGSYPAAVAPR